MKDSDFESLKVTLKEKYQLDETSVKIDDKVYNLSEIDNFALINLAITTKLKINGLNPYEYAAINNVDSDKIHEVHRAKYSAFKKLNSHLKDKTPAKETDFSLVTDDVEGLSESYIASRNFDKHAHILKKITKEVPEFEEDESKTDHLIARGEFVTELVTSKLYNRAIPKRSPVINLVSSDNSSNLHLSSKFFADFQTLEEATEAEKDYENIGWKIHEMSVKGFSKVVAASMFLGEGDPHSGNIGVLPIKDEDGKQLTTPDGKPLYEAVKIDHGRSSFYVENTSDDMIRSTYAIMMELEYNNVKFSLSEFRETVKTITGISDDEIRMMVKSSISELKEKGFKFEVSMLDPELQEKLETMDGANMEEKLENYYSSNLIRRRDMMKEIDSRLELIEKFSDKDMPYIPAEEFKNKISWLEALAEGGPPEAIAEEYGYAIGGPSSSPKITTDPHFGEHTTMKFGVFVEDRKLETPESFVSTSPDTIRTVTPANSAATGVPKQVSPPPPPLKLKPAPAPPPRLNLVDSMRTADTRAKPGAGAGAPPPSIKIPGNKVKGPSR